MSKGTKIIIISSILVIVVALILNHFFNTTINEVVDRNFATPKKKTFIDEMNENEYYKEHKELYENYKILNDSIAKLENDDAYLNLEGKVLDMIESLKNRSDELNYFRKVVNNGEIRMYSFNQKDIKYIKNIISESIQK